MSSYLQLMGDPLPNYLRANASTAYGTIAFQYALDGDVDAVVNGAPLNRTNGSLATSSLYGNEFVLSATAASGWLLLGDVTLQTGTWLAWVPSAVTTILLGALLFCVAESERQLTVARIMAMTGLELGLAFLLLVQTLDSNSDYARFFAVVLALCWTLLLDAGDSIPATIWALATSATGCVLGIAAHLLTGHPLLAATAVSACAAGYASLGSVLWRLVKRKMAMYALAQAWLVSFFLWMQLGWPVLLVALGSASAQLALNAPVKTVPLAIRVTHIALVCLLLLLVDAWPLLVGWGAVALLPKLLKERADVFYAHLNP